MIDPRVPNKRRAKRISRSLSLSLRCKQFDPERKIITVKFPCHSRKQPGCLPALSDWSRGNYSCCQMQRSAKNCFRLMGGQGQIPTASHLSSYWPAPLVLDADSPIQSATDEDVKKLPEMWRGSTNPFFHNFLENGFQLFSSRDDGCCSNGRAGERYIALGNMMTVAAQLGIDSCPMKGLTNRKRSNCCKRKACWRRGSSACPAWWHSDAADSSRRIEQGEDRIIRWVN